MKKNTGLIGGEIACPTQVEVWISYNPNEKPNKKFYGS
jgi:hypothetical protein